MNQRKHQCRDREQYGNRQREPAGDESQHRVILFCPSRYCKDAAIESR
jgi:hypothetical protein